MKSTLYTILALALLLTPSCQQEKLIPNDTPEESAQNTFVHPVTLTFTANAPKTKVSLENEGGAGEKTAVWEKGDRIAIICYANGKQNTVLATAESHGTAGTTFTATVEDAEYYYAVYPHTVSTTLNSSGNFSVKFTNNAEAATAFSGAARFAAKTTKDSKTFAFHPISTVIKFTLDGTATSSPCSVYLRSMAGGLTKLYGTCPITFAEEEGYPLTVGVPSSDGAGNVTAKVSGTGTYYLSLPATGQTANEGGFVMQIQGTGETIPAAHYSTTISLTPGKLYNIKSAVDSKVIRDYYVATETKGSGGGLSPANAETIAQLKASVPAFKYDTFIAGALLLDGTTIHILGDASAYTEPLGSFNTNASSPEHSYTIVGGEGGGTTTFTTASQSVFNSTPPHIIVRNITFSGCTAGAVKVSAGNVSFDHCVFSGNTATNGGAVSVSGSASSTDDNLKVAFSNCLLTNNSATAANTTGGGAVLVSSGTAGGLITFNNCRFDSNTAPQGASLYTVSTAAVFFNQCTFYQEKATNTTEDGINGYSIYSSSANGRFGMNNCTLHAINRAAESYNAAKNGTQVRASGYSVISNSSLWSSGHTGNRGMVMVGRGPSVATATPLDNTIVNSILHEKSSSYNALFLHANYKVRVLGCIYDGKNMEPDGTVQIIEGSLNRGDKNNLAAAGITPKTDQKVNGIGHTNYIISDKSLFCNAFVPVSRAYVKNAIRSTSVVGALFYDWLKSIGALDVDIMGRARSMEAMTPGSYDCGWTTADIPSSGAVPSVQRKYAATAAEDLDGKVSASSAGLKVLLQDSKFYAAGERVLSVSYDADSAISSEGNTVTMTWESDDDVHYPAVCHAPSAGEFGLLCLPGSFSGKFTVVTSRHSYEFTRNVTLNAGETATVTLDFASPDTQPTRKVGILGDSISTYSGELCNEEYSWFYPDMDPNYNNSDPALAAKAVDTREKTWWWRVIYNKMSHGTVDVVNSWGGTKLVHETKAGRVTTGTRFPSGFIDRAYNFVDPDIIFIHGGTNDVNQSTPLGEYTWDAPLGEGDRSQFRSCYIELIKALQKRYRDVKIIIIVGDRLTEPYETSAVAVAEHFGLPYVNFVGDTIEKCAGSHPTAPAFEQMAEKIYTVCEDYLP